MAANIEIYGQDSCCHCTEAVAHCESNGLGYVYRDIANALDRQEMLRRNPRAKTVPQVFVGDHLVGGCTELLAISLPHIQQLIGE